MSLLTSLVWYWTLDEASGTRASSVGTRPLTAVNGPVAGAGNVGSGCDLEASSLQYLTAAADTFLDVDFTYAVWFKRETFPAHQQLISKDDVSSRQMTLYFDGVTQELTWNLYGAAGVVMPGPVANDTNWHFVVVWHDSVANTVSLQLDNGTVLTSSVYGSFTVPGVNLGLRVGARQYAGFEHYFDGVLDELGYWARVLTAGERTALYNGGAGVTYPFSASTGVPATPTTYSDVVLSDGPSNYWRLSDTGSTAADSAGSAPGTISGGVTLSQPGALADGTTAMLFDGVDDKIVTTALSITPAGGLTLEGWLKRTALVDAGILGVTFVPSGPSDCMTWMLTTAGGTDYVSVFVAYANGASANSSHTLTLVSPRLIDGAWHHVVVVVNGTALTARVDGVAQSFDNPTLNRALTTVMQTFQVGYSPAHGTFHTGWLDEIAIYPRALTPTEISEHYAARTFTGAPFDLNSALATYLHTTNDLTTDVSLWLKANATADATADFQRLIDLAS